MTLPNYKDTEQKSPLWAGKGRRTGYWRTLGIHSFASGAVTYTAMADLALNLTPANLAVFRLNDYVLHIYLSP